MTKKKAETIKKKDKQTNTRNACCNDVGEKKEKSFSFFL